MQECHIKKCKIPGGISTSISFQLMLAKNQSWYSKMLYKYWLIHKIHTNYICLVIPLNLIQTGPKIRLERGHNGAFTTKTTTLQLQINNIYTNLTIIIVLCLTAVTDTIYMIYCVLVTRATCNNYTKTNCVNATTGVWTYVCVIFTLYACK